MTIRIFSPFWRTAAPSLEIDAEKNKKLELEYHLALQELGKLQSALQQKKNSAFTENEPHVVGNKTNVERALHQKTIAMGRVMYRDPSSWSSSLWIDVGEEHNSNGVEIIKKNSPVVLGRAVVGILDYVGKRQSRVRLITDVGLKLGVRALRGNPQNAFLRTELDAILSSLRARQDLSAQSVKVIQEIEKFRQGLNEKSDEWLLAKGILYGASSPLWRSTHHTLRGIGFNYDSESRSEKLFSNLPIIEVGDLLVTSGLDGIFPPGLKVAEVTKVFSLKEGDFTYEIEARPVISHINEISTVFIIPPVGFESDDI